MLKWNKVLLKSNADQGGASSGDKPMALDDARRVKVLSPSMMVFKRFIRNKLAIIGFIILVVMFLFSFVGPLFSPYLIAQLFTNDNAIEWKTYATGKYNTDPRYFEAEGVTFNSEAKTAMLLALSDNYKSSKMAVGDVFEFSTSESVYSLEVIDADAETPTYVISAATEIASTLLGRITQINPEYDIPELRALIEQRASDKGSSVTELTYEDQTILVNGKFPELSFQVVGEPNVLATYNIYITLDDAYQKLSESFDFAMAIETAIRAGHKSVRFDNVQYAIDVSGDEVLLSVDGNDVMMLSDIAFGAYQVGTVLTNDFYLNAQVAMRNNSKTFSFVNASGETTDARVNLVNGNYYFETAQKTQLLLVNEAPNSEHWLGTDLYGMDVLTRLMYGGRVSLMVGFVVVFFETFIGVIIGGISGFFGGWIDTVLMRLVDLVNAIPFYPCVIIIGAVLDHLKVSAISRIFLLMVVIGILGWTGIARVVRGQILSLREQDFMVATEATGIRTSRRIFRHLVPNVMPLLIVNATMGLGGVILTEATLGFLGLGVKYPMASWGSIINQATDMYVMTTAWWIWIPAGLFILLTVLGFNFVGDGLRDAFDPKMKR